MMLCNTSQTRAVEYLNEVFDQVPNFDELLQMAVIELIRKDCRNNSVNRVGNLLITKIIHIHL